MKSKEMKERKENNKTFSLTEGEISNLAGRREIIRMWDYSLKMLVEAVKEDINNYVDDVVKKRLGVSKEDTLKIDLEKGLGTVEKKEKKDDTSK